MYVLHGQTLNPFTVTMLHSSDTPFLTYHVLLPSLTRSLHMLFPCFAFFSLCACCSQLSVDIPQSPKCAHGTFLSPSHYLPWFSLYLGIIWMIDLIFPPIRIISMKVGTMYPYDSIQSLAYSYSLDICLKCVCVCVCVSICIHASISIIHARVQEVDTA